ncbi:MAG: magnesium transporter [Candidatus Rokubacteria bacterium]|nr:magnesium transporter [Candidatus Rokubacteria bacterium]
MEDSAKLGENIRELLASGRRERLAQVLDDAHAADVAAALRDLPAPEQVVLFRLLNREQAGSVLAEVDDQLLFELVQALDEAEISGILGRMEADDAARVVDELPEEQAEKLLDTMEEERSEEIQELLEYGEKTAGRMMSPDIVAVHEHLTVAQAIDEVRKAPAAESAHSLYVVDDHEHLVGVLPLRRLITTDPATPVRVIAQQDDVVSVTPETDQEDVARVVAKYDLVSIPVVDRDRRLLGVITVDDVIDVISEEATEDIQRLAGAGGDETVFDTAATVFPTRLLWRLVNLGTATLAASVIGLFETTIQTLATLAIFMPIVASMGGIGTTQTATVVIRGLALGEMTAAHVWRVLRKETLLALSTGLATATVMALIAYLWKGQRLLAVVIGVALILNMLVAALVGVAIPVLLRAFRVDPAIASSVIITAFTDIFGFFSFLGLASLLIHFLR